MLHCLLYWPCRSRIRRLRSLSERGSEWALELESAWLARPSALTAITRTIRMLARPTATMVQAGSLAGSLSAQAPGTTAGDIRITDAPTPAASRVGVRRFGAALKDAGRSQSTAEGSAADANN